MVLSYKVKIMKNTVKILVAGADLQSLPAVKHLI